MPLFLAPVAAWFVAKKTATLALGWVKLALYGVIVAAVVGSYVYAYVKGRDHGKAAIELSVAKRENAELKRAKEEVDRLNNETKGVQKNYDEIKEQLADATGRAAAADARLRQRTAEFKRAIASAPADRVRSYASGATDLYQTCRDEYQRLGYDAAAASNAAHALKKSNDLLSQRNTGILPPVAPTAPLAPQPLQ